MSFESYMRITGELRPVDTKGFRRVPLPVDEGVSSIRVRFSYAPRVEESPERSQQIVMAKLEEYGQLLRRFGEKPLRELEKRKEAIAKSVLPLRNLLNFCLYDPDGRFRGRWDSPQYFGKWIEVGPERERTSRGFLAGPIVAGEWTIEIEVHAVVTEVCTYELEIETPRAEAGAVSTRTVGQEGGRPEGAPVGEAGRLANARRTAGWWKGELHLHTNHSDGKAPLSEMIAAAKTRGLHFVVLSDHNTVSSHAEIETVNFPIVPAMELTTYYGHAVALGVRTFIDWREPADSTLERPIREVHAQGGLFSIAHPFTIGDPICTGCEWKYRNVDLRQVDLLEVWSGSWRKGWAQNNLAFDWWNRLLNEGYRIIGVAARDVHDPKQFQIPDTADTWVWAESLEPEAILRGLKSGRVFATSGPAINFSLEVEGREYYVGSEAPVPDGAPLHWTCRIDRLDGEAELLVVRNGLSWKRFAVSGSGTWRQVDSFDSGRFDSGREASGLEKGGRGQGGHDHGSRVMQVSWTEERVDREKRMDRGDVVGPSVAAGDSHTTWTRVELYRPDAESPDGRMMLAFSNPIWVKSGTMSDE